jgi:multidrug resistance protein
MLYAPGIPAMQRDFDSHDNTLATFSMSIYVLGFSVGPLVFAPLSEVYGRVVIYRCCLAAFLCFTVACALSSSINMLVGFRFVAGCFGAAPVAIGGAMVYDLFRVDDRGVVMAICQSGPIFGNLLGPPLGGLIIQHKSWRWVFWVITIFVRLSAFRSEQRFC